MQLTLFVLIVLAVGAEQVYSQSCHLREVDLCVAIGMFHYQSNGIPSDDDKVNDWCETMTEVSDCIGNFSAKCMSPLQREMAGLFRDSDGVAKEFCTPGSDVRASYLEHAECLAEGSDTEEFKSQLRDIQVSVEKMFDVPYKKRFPLICCAARRFHEDLEAMTEKRCGKASVEMLQNIVKMIVSDFPELVCARFDPKSDECKAILPPSGTPSKGANNKSQIGKLMDTVFGNL